MENLLAYLKQTPKGRITDTSELEKLLSECWDEFAGDDGGLTPQKLHGRMEEVRWMSPILEFVIERHGGTAMGSSRAELQLWKVDIERKIVSMGTVGYRQIIPRQTSLDVKPIAEEIAQLIIEGKQDERLQWSGNDRLRIPTDTILDATLIPKQTLQARRKRLLKALEENLSPYGWERRHSWWVKTS